MCAFIGCHCTQVYTQFAKLVDEKNIDHRCTSYKLKTTTVKKKVDFSYEQWYTYYE